MLKNGFILKSIIKEVILYNCNKNLCLEIADTFIKNVLTFSSFNFGKNTLIDLAVWKCWVSSFNAYNNWTKQTISFPINIYSWITLDNIILNYNANDLYYYNSGLETDRSDSGSDMD